MQQNVRGILNEHPSLLKTKINYTFELNQRIGKHKVNQLRATTNNDYKVSTINFCYCVYKILKIKL